MSATATRIGPMVDSFISELKPHSSIIDIGAGKGLLAEELVRRLQAQVTMVDVAQYHQTDLPFVVCDSRALAFCDCSFDYAVLSFVLHHSPSPEAILSEALRTAGQVVILENDVPAGPLSWVTRVLDSWPAIRYGTPPCHIAERREWWLDWFARFPVEVKRLGEFSLEHGFFRCFAVLLVPRARPAAKEATPTRLESHI